MAWIISAGMYEISIDQVSVLHKCALLYVLCLVLVGV